MTTSTKDKVKAIENPPKQEAWEDAHFWVADGFQAVATELATACGCAPNCGKKSPGDSWWHLWLQAPAPAIKRFESELKASGMRFKTECPNGLAPVFNPEQKAALL